MKTMIKICGLTCLGIVAMFAKTVLDFDLEMIDDGIWY